MKQQVIPAQITTVEDRIAGNLNFTQIILLMIPLFSLMITYAILPRPMHLTLYKIPVIIVVTLLCSILSLRIKGKVVLQWLTIFLTYNIRPTFYLNDKNHSYNRNVIFPTERLKRRKQQVQTKLTQQAVPTSKDSFTHIRLEDIVGTAKISFSVRTETKGGFNVAIKQK